MSAARRPKEATSNDAERARLDAARDGGAAWYRWGPYLSERQWGTVREDYSPDGAAWDFFPHDHARSRAYRWGEDGLLGICDDQGLLCFAPRALERSRPDPQGAALRPDRAGGQPRRGRQGVLPLPRQHADALLHEGALSLPAARLPVRRSRRREPPPRQGRAGIRTDRHRHLRREPLLRRRRRVREGDAGRHLHPHQRDEPRPRCRAAAPPADALVPQHLVVGTRRPPPEPRMQTRRTTACCAIHATHHALGDHWLACDGRARPALHRERDERRAPLGRRESHALRQGRHQRGRRAREHGRR